MFTVHIDNDIELALIEESLAAQYCALVSEQIDYLSQWLAWPAFCQSEQDFRHFIQRSLHDYAEGQSLTCAILYQGKLVGNCSLNSIDHDLSRAKIGYWLAQNHTGKGIITRSVLKLIDLAFNHYQIHKVELAAAVDNLPSRKVAERTGMKLEGIITNSEKVGDRILDHAIYAIHKSV
ncbi:GNAT family N-acetyltransferase [Vibrio scophthalmi]|uniref:GNAT family N-acetyltransferase n=1 Tax=Vibrio TaxID=662 RepID=UPI00021BE5CF|nr:GNAT family protein [Vibrio sp. N418]EGU34297.1 Ribosomal-protein-serine acetyltransferase [Vibrio sp. N418]